jgi:hypothetical protein
VHAVRESEFLPWAEAIVDGLERGQLSGKWLMKTGSKVDKETAVDASAACALDPARVGAVDTGSVSKILSDPSYAWSNTGGL